MPSPFPGMDPYLEAHWRDVHLSLITYTRDHLQAGLPKDLRARAESRVYLESQEDFGRWFYPDVAVVETPNSAAETGGVAVAAEVSSHPLVLHFSQQTVTERYIEIRDAAGDGKVITVIEFLNSSNKMPGSGRDLYLQKQQDCREAGVNLVEIDLLRAGERVFFYPQSIVPGKHRTPYCASVWRAAKPAQAEYYPIALQQRLPAISIPLRETDQDIVLALQPLLESAYKNGGYENLNYHQPPEPPLPENEAKWAKGMIEAAKKP